MNLHIMDLRAENIRLRRAVSDLLDRIESNQQIQRRFYDYEFRLLACTQVDELLSLLTSAVQKHFDLQAVVLLLADPEHHYRTLMQPVMDPALPVHFLHDVALADACFAPLEEGVFLGALSSLEMIKYFPGSSQAIKSCALLPLVQGDSTVGCLAFGSGNAERFTAEKSADFLVHLASVVAACIDNVVSHETLRRQTQTDVLTHLNNRRFFDMELAREIASAARSGSPLACVFLDIDFFKQVNDTHGHQTGDCCLQQVAEAIRKQQRKADVLARYGGEEFVCLLPATDKHNALQTAERIRQAVEELVCVGAEGQHFSVTISGGACVWQPAPEDKIAPEDAVQRLVALADEAMYEAKRTGRNRVCYRDFAGIEGASMDCASADDPPSGLGE
jgi:two-component system cell cycle response regulator